MSTQREGDSDNFAQAFKMFKRVRTILEPLEALRAVGGFGEG
jgi:hypothetical protein